MPEQLNETAYEVKPNCLIQDGKHPIDANIVGIESGKGIIKRGTVLTFTKDSKYLLLGTTLDNGITGKANCVVTDDTDTGSLTGSTIGISVYISGSFNRNALIVAKDYQLTKNDIEDLRTCGIFVSSANVK